MSKSKNKKNNSNNNSDSNNNNNNNNNTDHDNHLIKFPRTPHLFNTGGTSISNDDIIASYDFASLFYHQTNLIKGKNNNNSNSNNSNNSNSSGSSSNNSNNTVHPPPTPSNYSLILQEKIDGANLGISIDPTTYDIIFQNRSHYITPNNHIQFSYLSEWIKKKEYEIRLLLIPGRHILYGEWMKYQHSLYYDNLDDYFIIYDLYDKYPNSIINNNNNNNNNNCSSSSNNNNSSSNSSNNNSSNTDNNSNNHTIEGRFLSVSSLKKLLSPTTLSMVPIIGEYSSPFNNISDLLSLLNTKSKYRKEGYIEGIYLRIDEIDEKEEFEEKKKENSNNSTSNNNDDNNNSSNDNNRKDSNNNNNNNNNDNDTTITSFWSNPSCIRYNLYRSKLVRPDFIQGIEEHWTKKIPVKNQLKY